MKILLMFLMFVLTGCNNYTLNVQRSNIRSVGDNAITIALDAVEGDKVLIINDLHKIVESVQNFINSGDVHELTIPELVDYLELAIGSEYKPVILFLVNMLDSVNLNLNDAIGKDNVGRLNAACVGILVACMEYEVPDNIDHDVSYDQSVGLFIDSLKF